MRFYYVATSHDDACCCVSSLATLFTPTASDQIRSTHIRRRCTVPYRRVGECFPCPVSPLVCNAWLGAWQVTDVLRTYTCAITSFVCGRTGTEGHWCLHMLERCPVHFLAMERCAGYVCPSDRYSSQLPRAAMGEHYGCADDAVSKSATRTSTSFRVWTG
jgi:hypothetical protein